METSEWLGHVAAQLHDYYPGAEGNKALAEIVFGKTNPSGRLPFSWERKWADSAAHGNYPDSKHPTDNAYKEGIFLGYRWFDEKKIEPLFPFGFGLSYTRFELSDLKAARTGNADEVELSVSVRNAGERAGAEVIEAYATLPKTDLPRPPRELKAYGKVFLQPGEMNTVTLKVKMTDLAAWDEAAKKWSLVPGEYVFQAGDSSRDLPLKTALNL